MSATYEGMSPGGHETYATSIFSKIKTYLDSNPYGYVSKTGDTMTGNLTAPKFIGALQGNADTATSATTASKLGSSTVGSATQPIYLNGGTATACTYTLGKSVPSDAVFTDTKNTAGSTDTSSKLFLIGATSQAANPQTYSQDTAYVGTDGCLYSGGSKVLTAHQDISGKADKSATVSTVTWSNNKLTKTINGTTSDVVSAATILGNLTSSQVTTALGYTPASVNTTYDFESSDNSISFNGRAVGSVVTINMTVNGKVSTEGDTISGDYINSADFSESGVYGKRVTTYGPWGIDVEEYLADSLWSRLSLRDSDILLTKTWDGTNTSLRSSISSLKQCLSDYIKIKSIAVLKADAARNMSLSPYVSLDSGYKFLCWLVSGASNGWVTSMPIYVSAPGDVRGFPFWHPNLTIGGAINFYYLEIKNV